MSKQTATEWLFHKLWDEPKDKMVWYALLNMAKKMHKDEIMDAHIEGQRIFDKHPHTEWNNDQAEEYYNETYKTTTL